MATIKIKHLIHDDLIMYAKVAWEQVIKFLISACFAKAPLKGFDEARGDKINICMRDKLKITRN